MKGNSLKTNIRRREFSHEHVSPRGKSGKGRARQARKQHAKRY